MSLGRPGQMVIPVQSHLLRRVSGCRAAWRGRSGRSVLLALALALAWLQVGFAQSPADEVASRTAAIGQALQGVAEAAAAGAWQQADAAYNEVLEALDVHRPALEAALGPTAADAFAAIDAFLVDLDTALAAEDEIRVRAIVGFCQARLGRLEPGATGGGLPEEATTTALRWRSAVDVVVALAKAGAWRDARNAAIDLHADVRRRGAVVARAAGALGEADVAETRVFALRLRDAALDQSLTAVKAAAEVAQGAIERLLAQLGVTPTATPEVTARGDTTFRVFAVLDPSGERASALVLAQGVPRPGLGACRLRVRWSAQALRLAKVQWLAGEGGLRRDDQSGEAELSLPAAPTGPSGEVAIARLDFDVIGSTVDPRAYLPREELAHIEGALAEANVAVRRGDLPDAARLVTEAYVLLVHGRGRTDSLYGRLAEVGWAGPWAQKLLGVLEALSEPLATDVIVAGLAASRRELGEALAAVLMRLDPTGIPITVEVVEAFDTAGMPLPLAVPQHGVVPLRTARRSLATASTPEGRVPTTPPASARLSALPSAVAPAGTPTVGSGILEVPHAQPTRAPAAGLRGMPVPAVRPIAAARLATPLAVLLVAAGLAVLAALGTEGATETVGLGPREGPRSGESEGGGTQQGTGEPADRPSPTAGRDAVRR